MVPCKAMQHTEIFDKWTIVTHALFSS